MHEAVALQQRHRLTQRHPRDMEFLPDALLGKPAALRILPEDDPLPDRGVDALGQRQPGFGGAATTVRTFLASHANVTVRYPGDAEQREVQLVGADVLTLRHAGEPLLRHHPVLVVGQVQEAPGLPVEVAGLDVGRHVAGAQPLVRADC